MTILAIDPGPKESAFVLMRDSTIIQFGKYANEALIRFINSTAVPNVCVIEQIRSYGMAVGAEVFDTCVWSGRFCQAFGADRVHWLPRLTVKTHLCHSAKANDGNIRQAILDRFGGKEVAIGKKANPGPLYGVSGDVWAALAVALTWMDRNGAEVAA